MGVHSNFHHMQEIGEAALYRTTQAVKMVAYHANASDRKLSTFFMFCSKIEHPH